MAVVAQLTVTLHLVGPVIKTITKKIGHIADSCNFNARGTGLSSESVSVTELLCSQVCYIELVMSF
jgi:hypothetical protein